MTQATYSRMGKELRPGEKLLWSGKPKRGLLFHPASILLIVSILFIVGLIGGLLALNNMTHAIRVIEIVTSAARQRFTLTGLISGLGILLGLVAIWGFIFYPLQRRTTVYALTDQRAVVVLGLSGRKVRSFPLSSMNFTALTRRTGNKATVIFGEYPAQYAGMDVDQKQEIMDSWKWFGYKFELFEIGRSSVSQSQASRRPVFGRFEHIENSRYVYDTLRQAAGIGGPDPAGAALVEQPLIAPFMVGVVRSPGIITFVVDVSGSMEGEKLVQAKRGLVGALRMAENNHVGLLAFDNTITARIPVVPLTQNRQALTGAIQQVRAGASTALYDAIKEGIEMTDSAVAGDGGTRAVVVLTDGNANAGKSRLDDIIRLKSRRGSAIRCSGFWSDSFTDADGSEVEKAEVLGCGLSMKTRHPVQVFFIGIGSDADMEIGRMLAEATGAESEKGIELPSGARVERVRRVREVDIARVLEEFKYF